MSSDELIETLKEFEGKRYENLKPPAKDLFDAIMKIADERALLQLRIDKTIEYTNRFINGKTSRIDDFRNVELVLENIVELLKGEEK